MRKAVSLSLCVLLVLGLVIFLQHSLGDSMGTRGEGGEKFSQVQINLLDFLGGARQFLSYVLYLKLDKLHHAYYGDLAAEAELIPYYYLITYLDPHYVDAYYVVGETIFLQGQEEEAIAFTLRGIKNNPHSADLYASLADLYLRQKKYPEAREAYRRALEGEPEIVTRLFIYSGMAAVNLALQDWQGALDAYRMIRAEYQFALLGSDLDSSTRDHLVNEINFYSNRIAQLEHEHQLR